MDPQGKRKQGIPKATWRRTAEKEIKAMGLTWDEAEMAALDRIGWRQRVEVSCLMHLKIRDPNDAIYRIL